MIGAGPMSDVHHGMVLSIVCVLLVVTLCLPCLLRRMRTALGMLRDGRIASIERALQKRHAVMGRFLPVLALTHAYEIIYSPWDSQLSESWDNFAVYAHGE